MLSFFYVDKSLAIYLHALHLSEHYPFLDAITILGESKLYLVSFFLLALLFRYGIRRVRWEASAWFLWLCVLVPNLICLVLKVLLGRARPELWFQDQLFGFYGFQHQSSFWSFPSGHTTTIMGLIWGLSILFPRYVWIYGIIGFVVVVSRLLLLQHYLSDVMIAAYLALLEVGVLWLLLRQKMHVTRALVM
jgi:membrane-associated phospholipid phosphatase